jgi:hypothetical protein
MEREHTRTVEIVSAGLDTLRNHAISWARHLTEAHKSAEVARTQLNTTERRLFDAVADYLAQDGRPLSGSIGAREREKLRRKRKSA